MPLPLIVSFDGNIGSGKSTTCYEYEQYLKNGMKSADDAPIFPTIVSFEEEVCFVDEPVELWNSICDKDGVNILTNLYNFDDFEITLLSLLIDSYNLMKFLLLSSNNHSFSQHNTDLKFRITKFRWKA